jgi:hypothetical protein
MRVADPNSRRACARTSSRDTPDLFEFRGACFEAEPDFVVELVIESNAATGILQTIV